MAKASIADRFNARVMGHLTIVKVIHAACYYPTWLKDARALSDADIDTVTPLHLQRFSIQNLRESWQPVFKNLKSRKR